MDVTDMDVTDTVAAERQRVIGLADLTRIPLRRWRLVLATTAAVVLTAVLWLGLGPATYTAAAASPTLAPPSRFPSWNVSQTHNNPHATIIDRAGRNNMPGSA